MAQMADGTVVRALASHQCGPGSILGVDAICRLSLLLVLVPAPRVFLRVLRFSSLHKNQHFQINSTWKQWTNSHSVDVPLKIPIYFLLFYFKSYECSFWLVQYPPCSMLFLSFELNGYTYYSG